MIWVTGASGDLGRPLCAALHRAGVDISVERCDVTDDAAVATIFSRLLAHGGPPKAVFHCASFVELARTEKDPARTALVNEVGTINVLEGLARLGLRPWFCAVGSGHPYEPAPRPGRVREDAAMRPRSAYAVSKLNAERWALLLGAAHGIPIFAPRIFSCTGPGQRSAFVVPRLAEVLRKATPGAIEAVGWLGAHRDFLDLRDVADALMAAWRSGLTGTYNVCRGQGIYIRDVANALMDMRPHGPVALLESAPRPDDVEWLVGDPGRFEQATGFRPRIPWEQTLRDVWEAAAADPL